VETGTALSNGVELAEGMDGTVGMCGDGCVGSVGGFEMTNAFDVFIDGTWVNRVFDQESDPAEVRRSLVNHDGYSASIEVKRGSRALPKGRCWREAEIQQGYRSA
jgi:hypothetical protein